MKFIRIMFSVLIICGVAVLSTGCGRTTNQGETEEQTVIQTVTRGDLSLDISAVGNLALSTKETLSFELAGTISEVMVEEGDYVEEGMVLAELDTSERQDYLKTLSKAIETSDQALLQAEINHQNAEKALKTVSSQSYADLKIAQAELEVANARISLNSAQEAYDKAKEDYEANWTVPERIRQYDQKTAQLAIAQANLDNAELSLAEVTADIELEIEIKEKELVIVASKLEDAQTALADAEEALAEARKQDWNIVSPFEGFITKVNIKEGSNIQGGAAAIEIADPDEFEAEVYVSEIDIFNIEIGIPATAQVDAAQTVILPAEVTKIAPTATIQSGVVNYAVTVKIRSTVDMTVNAGETMQRAMEDLASGELPEILKRAVEAGRLTQEEAEEMAEAMQNFELPEDFQGGIQAFGEGEEGELPFGGKGFALGGDNFTFGRRWSSDNVTLPSGGLTTAETTSSNLQLREGLTVTVSIVTEEVTDVLLVPSAAITMRNGINYVMVVLVDGTTEERAIETGESDWQNTEVISGLSEGEQVEVTLSSSTSSTESQTFIGPGAGINIRR